MENLIWPQINNITLKSINGPNNVTVDGSNNDESVIYVGNDQKQVNIEGLKITGGYGSMATFHGNIHFGGGILIDEHVNATIKNCVITGNGNTVSDHGGTYGGGIFVSRGSIVDINNSIISNNKGGNGGQGASVYYRNFSSKGSVKNSIIYNNSGSFYCQSSPINIINNTIYNNKLGVRPGEGTVTISNNVILSQMLVHSGNWENGKLRSYHRETIFSVFGW